MNRYLTTVAAVALFGGGVAAAKPVIDVSTRALAACGVHIIRHTTVKRVPSPPPPAKVVYRDRSVTLECAAPLAINPQPVNTTFGPIDTPPLDLGHITAVPSTRQTLILAPPINTGQRFPAQPGIPASVPEPATWGMFIVGFGLLGGSMRHQRRSARHV